MIPTSGRLLSANLNCVVVQCLLIAGLEYYTRLTSQLLHIDINFAYTVNNTNVNANANHGYNFG